jgi:hypothetical protein
MKELEIAKPIISVKEARKLLGVGFKEMTDDQVLELVAQYAAIAKIFIHEHNQKLQKENV